MVKSEIAGDGESPVVESEEASIHDSTHSLDSRNGVVVDADREMRIKLYIGQVSIRCHFLSSSRYPLLLNCAIAQVFMGWFWFIPTFHMTHPRRSTGEPTSFRLTRKEVDFPLGIGSHIVDVTVSMEWCAPEADVVCPPTRQDSQDSAEGRGEPTGLGAVLEAAAIGETRDAAAAAAVGDE